VECLSSARALSGEVDVSSAGERDPANVEPLWDARDVAAYLKVSRSWVYQHAEDGTLPSVKVGGLVRFLPEQIRAYVLGERPAGTSIARLRPRE
jgi:excisionase family DNA binding protein